MSAEGRLVEVRVAHVGEDVGHVDDALRPAVGANRLGVEHN